MEEAQEPLVLAWAPVCSRFPLRRRVSSIRAKTRNLSDRYHLSSSQTSSPVRENCRPAGRIRPPKVVLRTRPERLMAGPPCFSSNSSRPAEQNSPPIADRRIAAHPRRVRFRFRPTRADSRRGTADSEPHSRLGLRPVLVPETPGHPPRDRLPPRV